MRGQHHDLERRHLRPRFDLAFPLPPLAPTLRSNHSADTPFEDGTFRLVLTFDESYPNKPPTVKFLSRMFHPNVYANGELCLDILQNRWSPTYDVAAILTSIQSLLHDPNPNRWVWRWSQCCEAERAADAVCMHSLLNSVRRTLKRLSCSETT
jgi:hypothetical protein